MTTKRRAPKTGYDFPAKERFRRWVWDFIGGTSPTGEIHTGDVLLMPSIEGREISDEAIPRGFKTSQLHVADHNPAIVATLQRNFPGLNTYGCAIEKACERITDRGVSLIAANVDYCGQISEKLLRSFKAVSDSPACEDANLFVTVLRGREEPFITSLITPQHQDRDTARILKEFLAGSPKYWTNGEGMSPTEMDFWRVQVLRQISKRYWTQARAYVSSNGQSFLTVMFLAKTSPLCFRRSEWDYIEGEPLPLRTFGETPEQYRARLTHDQTVRMVQICRDLGISSHSHFVRKYVQSELKP